MALSRTTRLALALLGYNRSAVIYDPVTREKYRYVERGRTLDKYEGRDDVYVSFTELNKLGINPQTKYKTPVGIYSYPVWYVRERAVEGEVVITVPFPPVERQNYVHIFEVRNMDKMLHFDLSDRANLDQFESQKNRIGEINPAVKANLTEIFKGIANYIYDTEDEIATLAGEIEAGGHGDDVEAAYKAWLDGLKNPFLDRAEEFSHDVYKLIFEGLSLDLEKLPLLLLLIEHDRVYDTMFDLVLPVMSRRAVMMESTFPYEDRLRAVAIPSLVSEDEYAVCKEQALSERMACDNACVWNISRHVAKYDAYVWTSLLRKMGFLGAIDNSTSTIHPSEPTQGMFFSRGTIELLETFPNKLPQQYETYNTANYRYQLPIWSLNAEKHVTEVVHELKNQMDHLPKKVDLNKLNPPREVMGRILKLIAWLNQNAPKEGEWSKATRADLLDYFTTVRDEMQEKGIQDTPEVGRVIELLSR